MENLVLKRMIGGNRILGHLQIVVWERPWHWKNRYIRQKSLNTNNPPGQELNV